MGGIRLTGSRGVKLHQIDARQEIRDRLQWIGARWALKAFGRLFRLYLTQPAARQSLKAQFGSSAGSLNTMGMGSSSAGSKRTIAALV